MNRRVILLIEKVMELKTNPYKRSTTSVRRKEKIVKHVKMLPCKTKRAVIFPIVIMACSVAVCAASSGDSGAAREFFPTRSFLLHVDGSEVTNARFLIAEEADVYIVESEALPASVRLTLRTQAVETLNGPELEQLAEGRISVPAAISVTPQGSFTIDGSTVTFILGDQEVRISPAPPLVGLQSLDALQAYDPGYGQRAADYRPDEQFLQRLSAETRPTRVRVYFATWCPKCSRYLPKLIRTMAALEGSSIQVEYFGLPRHPAEDPEASAVAAKAEVKDIPAAVVFRGDEEVGRIVGGDQWNQPEQSLSEVLAAGTGGP